MGGPHRVPWCGPQWAQCRRWGWGPSCAPSRQRRSVCPERSRTGRSRSRSVLAGRTPTRLRHQENHQDHRSGHECDVIIEADNHLLTVTSWLQHRCRVYQRLAVLPTFRQLAVPLAQADVIQSHGAAVPHAVAAADENHLQAQDNGSGHLVLCSLRTLLCSLQINILLQCCKTILKSHQGAQSISE